MIKLKDIVLQLKENDYQSLSLQFKETKADKYLTLLMHLRENTLSDDEISETLKIGTNAYYTLKSRLHSKVQSFLMSNILGTKTDILQRVSNIPQLLYNTPKNTSIAVLSKLEADLLESDMPWELTRVYDALKKLHIHTNKYYEFSQLYNKQVAYTIAIEKAEDLVGDFFKTLGNYSISRDKSLLDLLLLIKKEIANHYALYKSHHLTLHYNIINISFALFVPLPDAIKDDEPVEDMLDRIEKIFSEFWNDPAYHFVDKVYHFLAFEYYHSLKQHKKALPHFEEINNDIPSFMLYNFCCHTGKFLVSKTERYLILNNQQELFNETIALEEKYKPDPNDVPNYVAYEKYLAISSFYSGKYMECIRILNNLLNSVSLRNFDHIEVEIKLFLALCYCLVNNFEMANNLIKSSSRKIKELNNDDRYENALIFTKILSLLIGPYTKGVDEKIKSLKTRFLLMNQSETKMLEYLSLTDDFFLQITKGMQVV